METTSLKVPSFTSFNKSFNNNQTILNKIQNGKAPRKPPRKDSAEYYEHYPEEIESQDVLERLPNDIFDDFEGQDFFLSERRKSDMDIFDDIHRHLEEKGLLISDIQQRTKMIPEIEQAQTINEENCRESAMTSDMHKENVVLNVADTKNGVIVSNVEKTDEEVSISDVTEIGSSDIPTEYRHKLEIEVNPHCVSNVGIKQNDKMTPISDNGDNGGINGNETFKLQENDIIDAEIILPPNGFKSEDMHNPDKEETVAVKLHENDTLDTEVILPPNGFKSGEDLPNSDGEEKTELCPNVINSTRIRFLDNDVDMKSPRANTIQHQHISQNNGTLCIGETEEPVHTPLLEESGKMGNPSKSPCLDGSNTITSESEQPKMDDRKEALQRSILWLRQELMEMRKTDQTLIMQLMNIQMKIHSLKTEVFNSPPVSRRQLVGDFQFGNRRPSEEFYMDVVEEDLLENDEFEEDTELVDVEEENGEPVAWREFQRRLSCRRTFSKRGKLPGIIRKTSSTS